MSMKTRKWPISKALILWATALAILNPWESHSSWVDHNIKQDNTSINSLRSCTQDKAKEAVNMTWKFSVPKEYYSKVSLDKLALFTDMNETWWKKDKLAYWSKSEEFPSLWIGHAIWFPDNIDLPFEESFPALIEHINKSWLWHLIPNWVNSAGSAPWNNRYEFYKDSERRQELISFLSNPEVVLLQAQFILERFERSINKITKASNSPDKTLLVLRNIAEYSEQSLLLVMDNINFKGDWLNPKERFMNDKGVAEWWGLLQVLEDIASNYDCNKDIIDQLIDSAKNTLERRTVNNPPNKRYLKWWHNRLERSRKIFKKLKI